MELIVGFAAAALAAMGVGGGGLLIIYLTAIVGMAQRTAQGINLAFFLCASAAALSVHLKKRRISLRTTVIFGASGALGAAAGCLAASRADDSLLRAAFGWLLILSGTLSLLGACKRYFKKIS